MVFWKQKQTPIPYPYTTASAAPNTQYHEFNGAKFAYVLWPSNLKTDDGNVVVKARVLIVHGFGEYTQIYYRLMDKLSQIGIETFMFDQRGSGETSPGKLKGLTDEFHTFNDLDHFIDLNLKECGDGKKLFLFGHSMGGGIILNYGCSGKYKQQIAGIVCTGPLIVLHPKTLPNRLTLLLAPLLASCLPTLRIDSGLNLDGVTSDRQYREFLRQDPMSVPIYGTLRQIYDFMERGKKLYYDKPYVSQFDRPVLILHGEDDTINDPNGSKKFFNEMCTFEEKQLKLYPKARHSLCLETDRIFQTVFEDMTRWILERTVAR